MSLPDDGHCKLKLCPYVKTKCGKNCLYFIPEDKRKPNKVWKDLKAREIKG